MASDAPGPLTERQLRLERVLAEYLYSLESAEPLDRQALVEAHPELADDLRSFFRNRDAVERLAEPLKAAADEATLIDGSGIASPHAPNMVRYFGDYELVAEIARGGMGVVYRARQVSLNRVVALKMILSGQLASSDDVRRFRAEAEAAASLDHPNIVPIYEVGEHEGQQYFAMKLIEGESLSAAISRRACDGAATARIVASVARAVHHAHQRGVLHRDLKPGNVLLDSHGQPHVTDFGLAKRVEGDSGLTQSGAVVGTPSYMAPEQARAEKQLTTAVDVYSLGAILYELLTGEPPFGGPSPVETLLGVLSAEPPRPKSINRHVDSDLETICLKCLDKEPRRRYGSAEAFAEDLERWQRHEPVVARRAGPWERSRKWIRRHPAVAALSGALALLAVSGFTAVVAMWQRAEHGLYFHQIGLVDRAISDEKFGPAEGLLEACPPRFRDWEWQFLNRQAHTHGQHTLPGNPSDLNCLAFDDDGKHLVGIGKNGVVHLWHTESGQKSPIRLPELSEDRNNTIGQTFATFSPDGRLLAAMNHSGLFVAELATGKSVLRFGNAPPANMAFTPDGKILAAPFAGGERFGDYLLLWETGSFKDAGRLMREQGRIHRIKFSPNGKQLAVRDLQGPLEIWDLETQKNVATWELKASQSLGICEDFVFSVDGREITLVDFDDHEGAYRVTKWDIASGEESPISHGWQLGRFFPTLTQDGRRIVSEPKMGTVAIYDVASTSPLRSLRLHDGYIGALAASADGEYVATASGADRPGLPGDGKLQLWRTTTPRVKNVLARHTGPVIDVAFSSDNRWLVSAGEDGLAVVWNVATRSEVRTLKGHNQTIHALCFSPDAGLIATAGQDGTARIWNVSTGQLAHDLRGHTGGVQRIAFSADGRRLATASEDMSIRTWNVADGTPDHIIATKHGAPSVKYLSLAWSHDQRRLVTSSINSLVQFFDLATGERTGRIVPGDTDLHPEIEMIGTSAGGKMLDTTGERHVVSTLDNTAQVWRARTSDTRHRLLYTLRGHDAEVTSAAFHPSNQRLATGSADGAVKIWETSLGREVLTLRCHTAAVQRLVFSPDGRILVSAGDDGMVRLWDATPETP